MSLPPPTEKQARLIWLALTGLAMATLVGLVAALVWGLGRVLNVLAPVLWPIAVASVIAYLLDPVVDFFERKRVPRTRAIVLVFLIAMFLLAGVLGSVLPRLVVETRQLVSNVPTLVAKLETRAAKWVSEPPAPLQGLLERFGFHWITRPEATNAPTGATNASPVEAQISPPEKAPAPSLLGQLDPETVQKVTAWMGSALTAAGGWFIGQLTRLNGLLGFVAGLALIPIYVFYFLREKSSISDRWTDYLPLGDSRFKEELVFVLRSINDYLIAFFRGQVLVAMCDGVLYGIGFTLIGLPYAVIIGALAIVLTIIPFLGAIVTCGSALLMALVVFGDWQHPLLVLVVFAVVQGIEGYVLQPKIIGRRVGLHPMVIIIAIMTGTTLLGGLLGAVLAIPLAAALRVVMFRYIWKKRAASNVKREA
jgi:predicted PurR-regulated permease PerM